MRIILTREEARKEKEKVKTRFVELARVYPG